MDGFGKRLSAAREQRAMTRAMLAAAVDVTPAAIYNWEENDTTPRHLTLMRVAQVLGVSVEHLTEGSAGALPQKQKIEQILQGVKREVAAVIGVSVDSVKLRIEIEA
jgi:transcriptional regulator with XRE-family HTH domain